MKDHIDKAKEILFVTFFEVLKIREVSKLFFYRIYKFLKEPYMAYMLILTQFMQFFALCVEVDVVNLPFSQKNLS